jgi:hypothetical protein
MLEVGDRIRLSSRKGPDREGVITALTGTMVRVRWPSGDETTVIPAAGTLTVLSSASDRQATTSPTKKTAAQTAAKKSAPKKTAAQTAAKKGPTKKAAAQKTSAKKAAKSPATKKTARKSR